MAMMIMSRLVVLTMRAMPSALPISRMKNSGASRSFSADPIHHSSSTPPMNASRITWKMIDRLSAIKMPEPAAVESPLTPASATSDMTRRASTKVMTSPTTATPATVVVRRPTTIGQATTASIVQIRASSGENKRRSRPTSMPTHAFCAKRFTGCSEPKQSRDRKGAVP